MPRLCFVLVLLFGLMGSLFGVFWLWLVLIITNQGTVVRIAILLWLAELIGTGLWLGANLIRRAFPLVTGRSKTK